MGSFFCVYLSLLFCLRRRSHHDIKAKARMKAIPPLIPQLISFTSAVVLGAGRELAGIGSAVELAAWRAGEDAETFGVEVGIATVADRGEEFEEYVESATP